MSIFYQDLTQNPRFEHWEAARRVLRYLRGTINFGLLFKRTSQPLVGFADANWGSVNNAKSVSGYLFKLAGVPVVYRSIRQNVIALSTMEAEYISLSEAARELAWVSSLLLELGLPGHQQEPTHLWTDSQAAIWFSNSYIEKTRTKHISIRYHYLKQKVTEKEVVLKYVPTNYNVADILTKSLPKCRHEELLQMLGLIARDQQPS